MGRDNATVAAPPNHTRRAERARRAQETVNRAIPEMLRASPRARHGIHKADCIVDPSPTSSTTPPATLTGPAATHIRIRLQCTDTLSAAAKISERPFAAKRTAPSSRSQQRPNVTVLNMASPLRPGGGFLDGANSQEEFLCARTSLYPSLWDSFYRLPEVGGIYTPDVLVFRDNTPEANDIAKRDRYFLDVVSAGMSRFPDSRGRSDGREAACSCGVSYCDLDRELVTRKMKAVLRIAESKGTEKLILGAWGCGAYGNPVKEVAKIWRKVIAGGPRQRRPNAERWDSIKEIVFAIPDRGMLQEFERAFADILSTAPVSPPPEETSARQASEPAAQDLVTDELISRIAEVEMQLDQVTAPRSRLRLRETLAGLNRDLARGLANKAAQEDDLTLQEDEEVEDFVVSGFPASDGEDNSFYNFDENDVASDSSDAERSEIYEFRAGCANLPSSSTPRMQTDDDGDHDMEAVSFPPSPNFDQRTGWFSGSMDQLTRMLRLNHKALGSSQSTPGSPVLRPNSSGQEIDECTINAYLSRYGGTDEDGDVPPLRQVELVQSEIM